jgi:hypothetical protein
MMDLHEDFENNGKEEDNETSYKIFNNKTVLEISRQWQLVLQRSLQFLRKEKCGNVSKWRDMGGRKKEKQPPPAGRSAREIGHAGESNHLLVNR